MGIYKARRRNRESLRDVTSGRLRRSSRREKAEAFAANFPD